MNPVESLIQSRRSYGKISPQEERVLQCFDGATLSDWEDWRWQLRNRIRTKESLSQVISLTGNEEKGIAGSGRKLNFAMSPYFASLMDSKDAGCPIRLQAVPRYEETQISEEEMKDPCGEEAASPVHGVVHRYPDRVLFLVNEMCPMYCRYCTRSRMVGDGKRTLSMETYEAAFDYIKSNKKVRDVLISGGDPLLLSNSTLEHILKNIRAIKHVEFIRIGTRVPVSLPQRVTPALVSVLKKYNLWMSIHFNHSKEITDRVRQACGLLADSGIPLGSQTVLLRGINDDSAVMKQLMHDLLKIRVRPYYLYQCDPILGSGHFRTPVSVGVNIIKDLQGHTSGYAVPTFVIDAPGGGGKIPAGPNYVLSSSNGRHILRNFAGKKYFYIDPAY